MFQLNPSLKQFWRTRKPVKILKGGRFSSKTHDAGGMAAYLARNYSLRFLCIRQFQNRITDSVYTVVKEKIEQAGWQDEFDIGVSSIRHKITGSEFLFYGIARNLNDIKGTEGVDICWIEEGEGLTEGQWHIIEPTIRKEGSEIWLLYNPHLVTDFVEAKLPSLLGDDCIIQHINYDKNPFLSESAKRKAARLKASDPELYRHIYKGQPLSNDEAAIIKRTWIEAAVNAHKVLPDLAWTGRKTIGFDVADDGDDKCANAFIDGSILSFVEEWEAGEDELLKSTKRTRANAIKHNADLIGYDSIGVGAGVGSNLNDMNWRKHYKFNAAAKVANPKREYNKTTIKNVDFFSNLKAQCWWLLAERFKNTYLAITQNQQFTADEMISLDADAIPERLLNQVITELSTPHQDFDNQGKVKTESKKDLIKRGVASPNIADAVIIAASRHLLARASMLDTL